MKAHAKLSASGSARWIACPGSVKAEEGYPDTTSIFAEEGTAAHELAEMCLTTGVSASSFIGQPLPENNAWTVTQDMADYVQAYIDYVRLITGEKFIEHRVDFSHLVPEGFGTSDAIIINQTTMHVVDLKYGKGVPVSACENTQALLYALGALNDLGMMYDIQTITIVIVQPRLDHIDEWTISIDELRAWGERIAQAAERACEDDAPRAAGEKQCQWCKAKATCPELKFYTEKTILCEFENLDLKNPDTLTHEQLSTALSSRKLIVSWFDAIETLAIEKLTAGGTFPGYKLVEGRSIRAWRDETQAEEVLIELAGDNAYEPKKLLSVAKAEKLLGKTSGALLEGLITKPPGAPTLVPESDKRPSIGVSVADFD